MVYEFNASLHKALYPCPPAQTLYASSYKKIPALPTAAYITAAKSEHPMKTLTQLHEDYKAKNETCPEDLKGGDTIMECENPGAALLSDPLGELGVGGALVNLKLRFFKFDDELHRALYACPPAQTLYASSYKKIPVLPTAAYITAAKSEHPMKTLTQLHEDYKAKNETRPEDLKGDTIMECENPGAALLSDPLGELGVGGALVNDSKNKNKARLTKDDAKVRFPETSQDWQEDGLAETALPVTRIAPELVEWCPPPADDINWDTDDTPNTQWPFISVYIHTERRNIESKQALPGTEFLYDPIRRDYDARELYLSDRVYIPIRKLIELGVTRSTMAQDADAELSRFVQKRNLETGRACVYYRVAEVPEVDDDSSAEEGSITDNENNSVAADIWSSFEKEVIRMVREADDLSLLDFAARTLDAAAQCRRLVYAGETTLELWQRILSDKPPRLAAIVRIAAQKTGMTWFAGEAFVVEDFLFNAKNVDLPTSNLVPFPLDLSHVAKPAAIFRTEDMDLCENLLQTHSVNKVNRQYMGQAALYLPNEDLYEERRPLQEKAPGNPTFAIVRCSKRLTEKPILARAATQQRIAILENAIGFFAQYTNDFVYYEAGVLHLAQPDSPRFEELARALHRHAAIMFIGDNAPALVSKLGLTKALADGSRERLIWQVNVHETGIYTAQWPSQKPIHVTFENDIQVWQRWCYSRPHVARQRALQAAIVRLQEHVYAPIGSADHVPRIVSTATRHVALGNVARAAEWLDETLDSIADPVRSAELRQLLDGLPYCVALDLWAIHNRPLRVATEISKTSANDALRASGAPLEDLARDKIAVCARPASKRRVVRLAMSTDARVGEELRFSYSTSGIQLLGDDGQLRGNVEPAVAAIHPTQRAAVFYGCLLHDLDLEFARIAVKSATSQLQTPEQLMSLSLSAADQARARTVLQAIPSFDLAKYTSYWMGLGTSVATSSLRFAARPKNRKNAMVKFGPANDYRTFNHPGLFRFIGQRVVFVADANARSLKVMSEHGELGVEIPIAKALSGNLAERDLILFFMLRGVLPVGAIESHLPKRATQAQSVYALYQEIIPANRRRDIEAWAEEHGLFPILGVPPVPGVRQSVGDIPFVGGLRLLHQNDSTQSGKATSWFTNRVDIGIFTRTKTTSRIALNFGIPVGKKSGDEEDDKIRVFNDPAFGGFRRQIKSAQGSLRDGRWKKTYAEIVEGGVKEELYLLLAGLMTGNVRLEDVSQQVEARSRRRDRKSEGAWRGVRD